MSFDRVKINKVESIIAALSLQEQAHIGQYVARILGTAPPQRTAVMPMPTSAPAPAAPAPGDKLNRATMHMMLRRGSLVDFDHPTQGRTIRCRVKTVNAKSASCVPINPMPGDPPWWRVGPSLLRPVGTAVTPQQAAAQPVPTSSSVPSAEGAGSW